MRAQVPVRAQEQAVRGPVQEPERAQELDLARVQDWGRDSAEVSLPQNQAVDPVSV